MAQYLLSIAILHSLCGQMQPVVGSEEEWLPPGWLAVSDQVCPLLPVT